MLEFFVKNQSGELAKITVVEKNATMLGYKYFTLEHPIDGSAVINIAIEKKHTNKPRIFLSDDDEYININEEQDKYYIELINEEKKSIFNDMYGKVHITIHLTDKNGKEADVSIRLDLEILNHKLNENAILKMVRYVYQNKEMLTWSATENITSIELDSAINTFDDIDTIRLAEKIIGCIEDSFHLLMGNLHSKLLPQYMLYSNNKQGTIDGKSAVWAVSNLNRTSNKSGKWPIEYGGSQLYYDDFLLKTVQDEYNIYENLIIIGVIDDIAYHLEKIRTDITNKLRYNKNNTEHSFHEKVKNIIKSSDNMDRKLQGLLTHCYNLLSNFAKKIDLKQAITSPPTYTHIFKSKIGYRNLFEPIHKWYMLKHRLLLGEDFLITIDNIAILFEQYILFKLLDNLPSSYKIARVSKAKNERNAPNIWELADNEGNNITLYYNLPVKTKPQPDIGYELIDVELDKKGDKRPDYMIKIKDKNNNTTYTLLDAKFSNREFTKTHRLPIDVIKKYGSQFGVENGGIVPIILYGAICCDASIEPDIVDWQESIDFRHNKNYDCFSPHPHLPQQITVTTHPDWSNNHLNNIWDMLLKLHKHAVNYL